MTKGNVIIGPLILRLYAKVMLIYHKNSEDRKTETRYYQTCPWGIYAATRPRVDHDSSTLPPCLRHSSRPEVGKIARVWHNFLNFVLDCDGGRMKACSCVILKGPVRVEAPSQMALCGAPAAAPSNGEEMAEVEPLLPVGEQSDSVTCFHHVCQCHLDKQNHRFAYSIQVETCDSGLTRCLRPAVFTREEFGKT